MTQINGKLAYWKRAFTPYFPISLFVLLFLAVWGNQFGIAAADELPQLPPDVAIPPEDTALIQPAVVQAPAMGSHMVYMPLIVAQTAAQSNTTCGMSAEETAVANFAMADPNQGRLTMNCDPILAQVARERAQDMATRQYFSHIDPDGIGPNEKVRTAGYNLPSWYGSANNIESIAAGYLTAQDAWNAWLNSPGHRTHVLAEASFWADQTSYGIGYYYDANSPYRHYWVFLSAPPQ